MTATMHKITAGDGYTYLTKQVAAMDATDLGRSSLASYYSARGEHPGFWAGSGLPAVDLPAGSIVTEQQMRALFGEGRHPNASAIEAQAIEREIAAGAKAKDAKRAAEHASRLGMPFKIYTAASEFRIELAKRFSEFNLARGHSWNTAIPPSERARMRTELALEMFTISFGRAPLNGTELSSWVAENSRAKTTAVAGYDFCFSPVKSFSTLWAVAPVELKRQLEQAHRLAVTGALAMLEREATYTSIGRNGIATLDVIGTIATCFEHRDSRAGDPDLHTHAVLSAKVRTLDGRWRALDGCPIHRWVVAASETYNTLLEAWSRELAGLEYAEAEPAREGKRPIREVIGVNRRLCEFWSSRDKLIDNRRGQLARGFQRLHGREPTPVEALKLNQQANLETRQAKHEPRTEHDQRAAWRSDAEAVLGGPAGIAEMITAATHPDVPPAPNFDSVAWVGATADRILTTVAATRATWQRHHIVAEAQRQTRAARVSQSALDSVVERLVTAALHPLRAMPLGRTDPVSRAGPEPVQRLDGSSIYEKPGTRLYTSTAVLAAERRLLAAAELVDARTTDSSSVAIALLEYEANNRGRGLNPGQQALVREMATGPRRITLALAPAGTGKTTAMRVLTRAWQLDGGTVLGLAPTGQAAGVLREDIETTTTTIDALVTALRPNPNGFRRPDWVDTVDASTLVIIDEAAKTGTLLLDQAVSWLLSRGAKIAMIGDDHQLASVAAGGIVRDLAHATNALSLNRIVRFSNPSEGPASLAVRSGDPASLGFYLDNRRIHVGDLAAMEENAYQAWRADTAAGLDSVMLAPINNIVDALNARAHADRLAELASETALGNTVVCSDGLEAAAGDIICTRRNERRLAFTATDHVRNGYRWIIQHVRDDGSLDVTHIGTKRHIHLPADYVRADVTLGYATTADAAQGITVHTCHAVGIDTLTRAQLYVMLSRGSLANHLYQATALPGDENSVVTDRATHPDTIADHWQRILANEGIDKSATTVGRELADPMLRLGVAAEAYHDAIGRAAEHLAGPDVLAAIDTGADRIHPGLADAPAWSVLRRHLAILHIEGNDPLTALQQAADQRELDTANDPAAVLDWRLDPTGHHHADGDRPLPWLPTLPNPLTEHSEWGPYLIALRRFVTDLASQVRNNVARAPSAAQWACPIAADRDLLTDLTVWRSARRIPDTDERLTGPTEFAVAPRRYQQELDDRVAALLGDLTAPVNQWAPLARRIDPRLPDDPYWPVLANHLHVADETGIDIEDQLITAAAERPLPSQEPAAALWWRIAPDIPETGFPPTASNPSRGPLDPSGPTDAAIPADAPPSRPPQAGSAARGQPTGTPSRPSGPRTTPARRHSEKREEDPKMDINRSWDKITEALNRVSGPGKTTGDWVRYLCPVHEADGRHHTPSLGVTYNQQKQKTVIRCFAGCSDEAVLERLDLHVRDLFDRPPEHENPHRTRTSRRPALTPSLIDRALFAAGLPLTRHKPDLGRVSGPSSPVATYIYEWPDGRPEGKVTRVHTPHKHGREKSFWQERMTETGWQKGGFAHVPFRLPAIADAVRHGEDIYICEGEEDVLTANRVGLTATTNAGGALNWQPDHAEWLRGAHRVWIVADRDAPGYRHAADVAETLQGLVDEIRIVQARDGKDLTDHFNAGHFIDELEPVPLLDDHYRSPLTENEAITSPSASQSEPHTSSPPVPQSTADLLRSTELSDHHTAVLNRNACRQTGDAEMGCYTGQSDGPDVGL
ncbi:MobF family relaxase [Nocardia arthritidis]|uniref:Relaxase domain-containing protein n=1 Tax=Nocardia arthritidis TaxID=228602 RepID=A0A6G9YKW6_9NOCA|nr:MobF family relaxase [Nocardia arthritidis]QIS13909.1 relaxase domain-containing protein [Nocardia arthritidis]